MEYPSGPYSRPLYQSKNGMHDWILLLALTISALSLAAAWIVCRGCRNMRREKDRRIVEVIREQDDLIRELEHTRIEKKTLERALAAELSHRKNGAPEDMHADTEPIHFDTPYNNKR